MICTVQAEVFFWVVSYAGYVFLVPDHLPRDGFLGSRARMALFENDALASTRSEKHDFAIFIKTAFGKMAFSPRREAKSNFRDSEAHCCDGVESIVLYRMK